MAEVEAARAPGEGGTSTEGAKARVLTWNINGLRKVAADHGGLKELLDQFMADIGEAERALKSEGGAVLAIEQAFIVIRKCVSVYSLLLA